MDVYTECYTSSETNNSLLEVRANLACHGFELSSVPLAVLVQCNSTCCTSLVGDRSVSTSQVTLKICEESI